jgi:hypothetical protein
MLPGDSRSRWDPDVFPDERVVQFWDEAPSPNLGLDWNLINIVGGMPCPFVNPAYSVGARAL